jgi:hypothetical protein
MVSGKHAIRTERDTNLEINRIFGGIKQIMQRV